MKIELYGIMCSGKTTVSSIISKELSIPFIKEEFKDNPYLHNKEKSFNAQVWFFEQYSDQRKLKDSFESYVSDSGFLAGVPFSKTSILDSVDLTLYLRLHSSLKPFLDSKDSIKFYLDVDIDVAFHRIKLRSQHISELSLTKEYLSTLKSYYNLLAKEESMVIIPTDNKTQYEVSNSILDLII